MEPRTFNNIYKTLVVLLLAALLTTMYNLSRNGRYVDNGENSILDTRTGKIYFVDPRNGNIYNSVFDLRDSINQINELP